MSKIHLLWLFTTKTQRAQRLEQIIRVKVNSISPSFSVGSQRAIFRSFSLCPLCLCGGIILLIPLKHLT